MRFSNVNIAVTLLCAQGLLAVNGLPVPLRTCQDCGLPQRDIQNLSVRDVRLGGFRASQLLKRTETCPLCDKQVHAMFTYCEDRHEACLPCAYAECNAQTEGFPKRTRCHCGAKLLDPDDNQRHCLGCPSQPPAAPEHSGSRKRPRNTPAKLVDPDEGQRHRKGASRLLAAPEDSSSTKCSGNTRPALC